MIADPAKTQLRTRWLLNLGLLLAIAALAAFLLYTRGREAADGPRLTDVAPASIARLRLERNGAPIVLEKTGDQWRLAAPVRARANPFNVERLLRLAAARSEARFPFAPGEADKYGLKKPQARVWLDDEEIAFGALHPFHNQQYVRYRGEAHLIAAHHFAPAALPYTDYLDTRLFEEERRPVAFALPDFTLTLRDGIWRREPEDKTIASDRINDFVAEWRNARALSVERRSGRPALGQVRVTFARDAKTETLTLAIVARAPEFIIRRADEGLEYHFPEDTGKRLLNISEK